MTERKQEVKMSGRQVILSLCVSCTTQLLGNKAGNVKVRNLHGQMPYLFLLVFCHLAHTRTFRILRP